MWFDYSDLTFIIIVNYSIFNKLKTAEEIESTHVRNIVYLNA